MKYLITALRKHLALVISLYFLNVIDQSIFCEKQNMLLLIEALNKFSVTFALAVFKNATRESRVNILIVPEW